MKRFAPWNSPAWDLWRDYEKHGTAPHRFCRDCGWVHRLGNHGPKDGIAVAGAREAYVSPRRDRPA